MAVLEIGRTPDPVDRVSVTFDESVQETSFPPPAATLTGRAGPITVTGVNRLTDTDFESTFTPTRARPSGPVARRVKFATLSTAAGEVPTRTYQAMVTEWQLSFRLRDAGGSDFDAALNGLEIVRVS